MCSENDPCTIMRAAWAPTTMQLMNSRYFDLQVGAALLVDPCQVGGRRLGLIKAGEEQMIHDAHPRFASPTTANAS